MEKFKEKLKNRSQMYITIVVLNSVCLILANKWILPNIKMSETLKDICYMTALTIEIILIIFIMRIKIILGNKKILEKVYNKNIIKTIK